MQPGMGPTTEKETADENRARQDGLACSFFKLDEEDELVSDDERTCLNCRYRRWTADDFVCMKKQSVP
jgi:hypothetical protein